MLELPGYTLLGTLRATGANVLFHAVRDSDGLPVILKTPAVPSSRVRERYRQEHAILERLRDVPGVAHVIACEQLNERPVLLLEAVAGEPLSEAVRGPLEVSRFLELAIPLAATLAEVHRRGLIHKDLKPDNLILTPSGEVRLIDFGSATLQLVEHVDAAPASFIEGTLPYMSPEQTGRMNRSVDYRADFYALGVTFYQLLTGSLPLQGRDALEWFHAHLARVPKPPHELVPELPPALSAIVMKLLAKVAEARYQGAEGLKADLERCREGLRQGTLGAFTPGANDVPSRFQLPQRLYGRDAHIAALLEGFERVGRGERAELLLVSGGSGMGKSSVVHELHRPVVRRRGFFLSGKFDQFQRDIPYATLAQAIHGLVRQLLAGTDAELAQWGERLRVAWEGQGQVLVEVLPQLELVAGRQPAVPELPPQEAQARFHRAFRKLLSVFSSAEHPLVLFLDDLQWADLASLRLIQHLLTDPETPPVLWIGAYRDNEVSPSHPLALALEELAREGARLTELRLEPLSLEQTRRLVAEALPGAGEQVVGPLAAQVREKTGGTPFFLIQLLRTLHQDGLLSRTPEGGWRWDAEGVQRRGYSDNVVDFMVGRLRELPADTQHLLRLAACVGATFPLELLTTLSGKEPGGVERGLEPALQEGLLVRSGPEQYRFLHDRIQQAAHVLTPPAERESIHLRIGRRLLASLSPEEVRERLFDVVSQLNAGAGLVESPEERLLIARLNAEAGAKARASIAHRSAASYFRMAFALLPGDPWGAEGALAFRVRLGEASSEFLAGNAAEARRLVEELLPRAHTPDDRVAVYRLKSDLHLVAGSPAAAVDCLLECLAQLGMPMSPHPSWQEVVAANEEVWSLMGERSIASLLELPLMSDPHGKAVMDALSALFTPAYFTDPNLLILHLSRMVALTLRHGTTEGAVHGYAWYGLVLGPAFKRYREGHAFGQLACELVERHDFSASRGKALYSMELINYWTKPISISLELIRTAFHHALQSGDFQVACYCCNHIVTNRITLGHPLEEVYPESVARLDFARKAGFTVVQEVIHCSQRYVQQLRGLSSSFGSLSGDDFDEAAFEATLTPDRLSTLRCWYWILKMQARFMSGAYEEACEAASRAAELTWASLGHIQILDFHLYRALSLAAAYARAEPEVRERSLATLRKDWEQLQEWASYCPENFRAPERMVAAELARITGNADEAMYAYEEALRSARENGFIQNVGLAAELAAGFWRERRMTSLAESCARMAREAYAEWGAWGKVAHLDARWPHLAAEAALKGTTTTGAGSPQVDALALVKAWQAISGEIVQERLVKTLMQVAIENAGAHRGALLLPRGDSLAVVALVGASPQEEGAGAAADGELPWTVISYVRRTHEHVLIGDALGPHPFSADKYLASGRARSVLCLPLLRKEGLSGVLYLENDVATDAFTPARIALLGHLASQAAISIENARLYADVQRAEAALRSANDELERRVEERTRELKLAQDRLVETARAAGMSEVASNVLHNVGNVLTSAVVNLELMRRAVESSRIGRVRQVSELLESHRANLADFLTKDPRGGRVPEYLSALAGELAEEQSRQRESLQAMNKHLEHISAVIQVQQGYAKGPLFTEECDLAQLIEDALHIQNAALDRHGISVERDIPALPRVRVDKHKVLQILINLISNAKYAMADVPDGQRRLGLRLSQEGELVRILVTDNGMGIDPALRDRLFSHGFTTRKDGHGFGLHSSALAAKALGGRLVLDSAGPGLGTTALLELPIVV